MITLRTTSLVSLALVAAFASSCASPITRNGIGSIYTDVQDTVMSTDNAGASKTGEGCAQNILGLVSTGNMSVDAAKKSGRITKVSSIDYTQSGILGVYAKTCVIVRGE